MSVYLGTTKVQLKSAVAGTGPQPTPSDPAYEQVTKQVDFCKQVLAAQGGKGSYKGAFICLREAGLDKERFDILGSGDMYDLKAVRTSDGHFYTSATTHTWDHISAFTIDGVDPNLKFNWVIYYVDYGTNLESDDPVLECSKAVNIIYVFDNDIAFKSITSSSTYNETGLFRRNSMLKSFDFINNHKCIAASSDGNWNSFCFWNHALVKLPEAIDLTDATNFNSAFTKCYNLVKLPDSFESGNCTAFSGFCSECYALRELPEDLDTSKGTTFLSFCSNCYSLTKLPDGLDTSSGTNFNNFCGNCSNLMYLPDRLDTSNGTQFDNFCQNCFLLQTLAIVNDLSRATTAGNIYVNSYALVNANIKLPNANVPTLYASKKLTVDSIRYIANNAPTVTSKTLTLGGDNISRANAADPSIIQSLTTKGWTVN